ncbi:MmgE/PrpD family protein [Roseitranquillus sediminis]|uniref:MmgE/PrpD family protein n=1 Tax=Roseitranquillus sediminis TaxID=2809051 RepID=UPI001D0CA8D5|nr:MmgE/PrpD family protein [Roseitranquillus sediminis]MBM9593864.1 MmgE/PrpD family protein [Roseitranquillus sediminis]
MTDNEPIALGLARRIRAIQAKDLTQKSRSRAVIGIVDTIGVTLAGSGEDCVRILKATPGIADAPGPSALMGGEGRVSMLDAALINGTASHALDYDDFSAVLGGHQSVPLVAPLFALAEAEEKSGTDLVAAYAAGVEIESRLARAVHWHHYDKGWHPTATLGTIAAAGACAHMMGLDDERTAAALSIAVSQSAGVKANFGTMTKPLHVGLCGRAGLFSALLARQGFTASAEAFEHRQGFFEVFNGAGKYDAARLFDGWGAPMELEDDGLALKLWPCCGSAHAAIAAALELRKAESLTAEDIDAIEVMPHPRRLRHTDTPRPRTPLEGKFSVQYVVARALADGAVSLRHFEPDAVTEPRIVALLERLEARGHPEMDDTTASQWAAEVVVRTKDGRTLSHRIDDLMAGGRTMPASPASLFDKFEDCAERALPSDRVAALFERLETIDTVKDMAAVGRMLMAAAAPVKPASRPQALKGGQADHLAETHWVP